METSSLSIRRPSWQLASATPHAQPEIKLRDYQDAAVSSIFKYFEDGNIGNPLVALPTGTGKSLVQCKFMELAFKMYQGQRFMSVTHVKELIQQNYQAMMRMWPTAPAGVFSAGLGKKQAHFPITFAGIDSVVNCPEAFGKVDLLLIDEAHLVAPKDGTRYQKFIDQLMMTNPALKVIGQTATHYRLGQGLLTEGDDAIFTDLCFDMTSRENFNWLIDEGYLCQLIPKRTRTELDVSRVASHGGEFVQRDLQEAVDKDDLTYRCLRETLDLGGDRKHWLIFASGIEHAVHVRDMLESMGVQATCVHSKMPGKMRDDNIRDFKSGRYRAMVNNGILTTGFDFPEMDLIAMLRPTKSTGLWVQMLGRGTRPVYAPGHDLETRDGRLAAIKAGPKQNCLVLDFAGNTARLGPINDPIMPRAKVKGPPQPPPVKICPLCGTYNHASVRFCILCGQEFPRELCLAPTASSMELIASSDMPLVVDQTVDRVTYRRHEKADRPPSLKVTYYCGLRIFDEWVCLEHQGFAKMKARKWWRSRTAATNMPIPETVEEALHRLYELRIPRTIKVWENKKYPEILSHGF